jgi:pimeloyl-ACP methyl ester carboxylesterase
MFTQIDTKQSTIFFDPNQVTSADGTIIGYRKVGTGPGLILVHGGMMASQNFSQLAGALADSFTVYIPDRRGRGLSGPHGDSYCLARECEDMQALVRKTGAQYIFGLSSGAIIALETALAMPQAIRKVALYEPPLAVGSTTMLNWVPRFDAEIAKDDLAAAMVTVLKATGDSSILTILPRFMVVPLIRRAIEGQEKKLNQDEIPLKTLIPTMHFDPQLVRETLGKLGYFSTLKAELLLLGGSRSQPYLKAALKALNAMLPNARRVELAGLGHIAASDQGQPQPVADELRRFFG